ncbi:ASKHA domain-containing protein [Tepidibacter mesophilus]|uniref:ASKHA domain-containing protein n=1 Tax=Tepidibacter mesophilus TaxID=655607 RepID=UPI000C08A560|nr:ASKHA domain-containing protein [Tepidibacter mesophilus]
MSEFRLLFKPQDIEIKVSQGISILEAQSKAGLKPDAPCGGQGKCGKCLVEIIKGETRETVKSCATYVDADMVIDTASKFNNHKILIQGIERKFEVDPIIKTIDVKVEKCKVGDNSSDWKRLKDAVAINTNIDESSIPVNVSTVLNLSKFLNKNNYEVNVVMSENEIIDLRLIEESWYTVAFDIGTTTIVGYLLDGKTGEELCVVSMLNPQSKFGADVIMRSHYAIEHGVHNLSSLIRKALNDLIEESVNKSGISKSKIYLISIVGNTCMHHLLLGISPQSLVHSPYNASLSEGLILNARDYDITINNNGKLIMLPNIAGFVGADTVGVLIATEFHKLDALTLVIDIGTNGELVMGNKDRMITCSTAAGPAFEGAKIQCGMRGAEGAIDHVGFNADKLEYTTIKGAKPIGICGSGLIDIIANLFKVGIIDDSGKLCSAREIEGSSKIDNCNRIVEIDGMKCFVIVFENESGNGEKIFLSQKDIREVQLAKGAISAGINLMAEKLEIELSDIQQVFIAGAFGNYMSPQSACDIGLIPSCLRNKIKPIGNAAGQGSKICALNKYEYKTSLKIARDIEFLELATNPNFQEYFIDELEFPQI